MLDNIFISVVGLGYVGLPVALEFAKSFPNVIGFDINNKRVASLKNKVDFNGEISSEELEHSALRVASCLDDLKGSNFFIVAVPTPIDDFNKPDLSALISASRLVGRVITSGSIVVFESTVYPGVTEEICGPIIALESGLIQGEDFFLGYSPERINPGDKEHNLRTVVKVVSGDSEKSLNLISEVYSKVVEAGVHKAPSIRVAEAAKVIENTQRDLNIALMNELSIIFDRLEISTKDVLMSAKTKWNFLNFTPGLVGGHCIGVDPYYLTSKAEQVGYIPQVILAGRRINDSIGEFIAKKTVKLLIRAGAQVKGARVGILGLAFKENVSDIRNSRVPSIVQELQDYEVECLVHDPLANEQEAESEYGISLLDWQAMRDLDAIILAVRHNEYLHLQTEVIEGLLKTNRVLVDVKWMIDARALKRGTLYWSL